MIAGRKEGPILATSMEYVFARRLIFVSSIFVVSRILMRIYRPAMLSADMYRSLFKFGVFNAVQSTCYDEVRTALD